MEQFRLNLAENLSSQDRESIHSFLEKWKNDSDVVEVQTSGTTGESKKLFVEKSRMAASARMTAAFLDLPKNSRALLCLPVHYIAGKMMLVRSCVNDWELICVPPKACPEIPGKVDFAAMTPMQVKGLLKESPASLKKIRTLIIGGAPVDQALENALSGLEVKAYATFGMTETLSHIAMRRLNGEAASTDFHILSGVKIGQDHSDCLWIEAPELLDGRLQTRDIVELSENASSFRWMGRFDNLINSGGIKFFPEKIEALLEKHVSVPFFIASEKDEVLGERLILLLEGEEVSLPESIPGLDRKAYPKKSYVLPAFARTSSGKIQRKKTLEMLIKS